MFKTLFSSLAISFTHAATWDYATNNGEDWPKLSPDCGKENQSPIDLRTDFDVVEDGVKADNFNKLYTN